MTKVALKLIQIAVAQWGDTYSVLGLSDKGFLYRLQKKGWVALPMHVAIQNPAEGIPDDPDNKEPF